MTERRFDEDEAREIFERASRVENAPVEPGTTSGLTLHELQEIGAEVGLSPESIAHAAVSLDSSDHTGRLALMGLPVGVSKTVSLGRDLTDAEWEHLVNRLRHTFNARGKTEVIGSLREWWNGNLRIVVEATPTGDVLHMSTQKSGAREFMAMGAGMIGLSAIITAMTAVTGVLGDPGAIAGPLFLAAVGAGTILANSLRLPPWFRTRKAQFEGLARAMLQRGTSPGALEGPAGGASLPSPDRWEGGTDR